MYYQRYNQYVNGYQNAYPNQGYDQRNYRYNQGYGQSTGYNQGYDQQNYYNQNYNPQAYNYSPNYYADTKHFENYEYQETPPRPGYSPNISVNPVNVPDSKPGSVNDNSNAKVPSLSLGGAHENPREDAPPGTPRRAKLMKRKKSRMIDRRKVLTVEERRKKQKEGMERYLRSKNNINKQKTLSIVESKDDEKEQLMQEMFNEYDTNNDGLISIGELSICLESWGVELSMEHIEIVIASYNEDDDPTTLNENEFYHMMTNYLNLKVAFDMADTDDSNTISRSELRVLLKKFGFNFNFSTRSKLLTLFDTNNDGAMDFMEFGTLIFYLRDLKHKFEETSSNNKKIDSPELHSLLRAFGIIVTVREAEVALDRINKKKSIDSLNFSEMVETFADTKENLPHIQQEAERKRKEKKNFNARKIRQRTVTRREINRQPTRRALQHIISQPAVQAENETVSRIIQQCNSTGSKWVDPDFPTSEQSLFPGDHRKNAKIESWRRVSELSPNAQLFVDGIDEGDVIQGTLGDCWFLSALSVLAQNGTEEIQGLFVSSHAEQGFYQCRFFKDGVWIIVTIDDYIPCNRNGRPAFASCRDTNEFWVPILEKAYAKLHGCYGAIESGSISDGLVDLTGEAAEALDIEPRDEFWNILLNNIEQGFLMGCSQSSPDAGIEEETDMGILMNHAYGILGCRIIGRHRLLNIRNPWGSHEWKGRWSDGSSEWTSRILKELDHKFLDDGTFWMCFEDWCSIFNRLFVLRLYCDEVGDVWHRSSLLGSWNGENSGGCVNHVSFKNNPQYLIRSGQPGPVFISLRQRDRRIGHTGDKVIYPAIGLGIVLKENKNLYRQEKLDDLFLLSNYSTSRENTLEFVLPDVHGAIIIPNTFDVGEEGDYFLSIYTKYPSEVIPLLENAPCATMEGEWKNDTAGGCTNHPTWKNNPQYYFEVTTKNTIPLVLEQHPSDGNLVHIGMYVWKTDSKKRNLNSGNPIFQSQIINSAQVGGDIELEHGIYVVMPCTFHQGINCPFSLKIVLDDIDLHPVEELQQITISGAWTRGKAGGCSNHNTWPNNPQFPFSMSSKGEVTISLEVQSKTPMGFYIFDKDVLKSMGTSKFANTLSVTGTFELIPGEYVLLPCTFNPDIYVNFNIVISSEVDVDF
eukprot:TRINITY_DN7499_c0_g1_i1.p1 TRINITY_DN7499_c0_g1~~TRINITY_DN7499_c0_g1_i1.p1  ORF type:complete len:1144 (-),score=258.70 TRINITY_DN7499_c0_g1_i1:25-3456(-)